MPTICPKCGGLEPGCSVCDAPPRRSPDLIEMVTEERRLAGMGAGYPMTLYWPVPEGTRVTQVFGANPSWYPTSRGHNGVDFGTIVDTPCDAMKHGKVVVARNDGKVGYGRHVRIEHDDGISIYGHLHVIQCAVGNVVEAGQQIGLTGGATNDPGSGWSTGPHLHAEYRLTDIPNPVPGGYVYNAIDILPLLTTGVIGNWEVLGIDQSAWNGVWDYSIGHKKLYQYAWIRFGYGDGWKDSRCDQYRQDAIAHDMPYGGYWYNKVGQDKEKHATAFYQVALEYPFQLGLREDYEYTTLGMVDTLNWIIAYDQRLKGLLGGMCRTAPYSNMNFWNTKVAPNNYFTDEQWVAHWTTARLPLMPNGWVFEEGCDWQHSADGNGLAKLYGMVSDGDYDIDLNRHYGTVDQFNVRNNTHILPLGDIPQPPPTTEFMMECIVNSLYVREGPGVAYRIAGSLSKGQQVALKNVAGASAWMQIKSGPYAGKWCAVQTSYRYMEPVE